MYIYISYHIYIYIYIYTHGRSDAQTLAGARACRGGARQFARPPAQHTVCSS